MAKIRFLMDVHVHRAITAGMRRRGAETLTAQEAGLATAGDEKILEFAHSNEWVVFSQDDDFLKLCSVEGFSHKGLIYSHKRNSVSRIIQGLFLIFEVLETEDMIEHIEFV
ncbi:MAG: DUF5615 family PIN-like protein [Saprospiraceae bacterium]|nr:DUF5615 family PIN-like protein [Saprospiraceae bacterium]